VHSPASKRGAPSLNGLVASLVALFADRPELGIVWWATLDSNQ